VRVQNYLVAICALLPIYTCHATALAGVLCTGKHGAAERFTNPLFAGFWHEKIIQKVTKDGW
jgi:hypothetical protein